MKYFKHPVMFFLVQLLCNFKSVSSFALILWLCNCSYSEVMKWHYYFSLNFESGTLRQWDLWLSKAIEIRFVVCHISKLLVLSQCAFTLRSMPNTKYLKEYLICNIFPFYFLFPFVTPLIIYIFKIVSKYFISYFMSFFNYN